MGAAENKALIRTILKAYAQSDLAPLLEAIHADIVWTSQAPAAHYGFGGSHKGRAGTLAGMAKIATAYQLNHYRVTELVGEGDVVWMTATVAFTHRRSGTQLSFPLVSRWQFQDAKVIALTEYFDSATLLIQEGRLGPLRAATG
ncbi:MAG TPA: nuclear transport factor 2 family protein [Rhizomicrobium sp.]